MSIPCPAITVPQLSPTFDDIKVGMIVIVNWSDGKRYKAQIIHKPLFFAARIKVKFTADETEADVQLSRMSSAVSCKTTFETGKAGRNPRAVNYVNYRKESEEDDEESEDDEKGESPPQAHAQGS